MTETKNMWLRKLIHRIARGIGYDIVGYQPRKHPLARRTKLLESYNINLVLDVGANIGQYGQELREIGYKGKIISFEPLSMAYKVLSDTTKSDDLWVAHNFALGDKEDSAMINVAGNSYSSSLLDILPSHLKSAPESKFIGKEEIQTKTLDSIFPSIHTKTDNVYLKIDTQGFEKNVLKGAGNSLHNIDTIQLEMSLTPLYKDELSFIDMYQLLYQKGYRLVAVEPGFTDEDTGQLLQIDGIFHRL
jgi:FkbM family methyltransferase